MSRGSKLAKDSKECGKSPKGFDGKNNRAVTHSLVLSALRAGKCGLSAEEWFWVLGDKARELVIGYKEEVKGMSAQELWRFLYLGREVRGGVWHEREKSRSERMREVVLMHNKRLGELVSRLEALYCNVYSGGYRRERKYGYKSVYAAWGVTGGGVKRSEELYEWRRTRAWNHVMKSILGGGLVKQKWRSCWRLVSGTYPKLVKGVPLTEIEGDDVDKDWWKGKIVLIIRNGNNPKEEVSVEDLYVGGSRRVGIYGNGYENMKTETDDYKVVGTKEASLMRIKRMREDKDWREDDDVGVCLARAQLDALGSDTKGAKRLKKAFRTLMSYGVAEGDAAMAEDFSREKLWKEVVGEVSDKVVLKEKKGGKLFCNLTRLKFLILELACRQGFNDVQCGVCTGMSLMEIQRLKLKYPMLGDVMRGWRDEPLMLAQRNVFIAAAEGDIETSKWLLERRDSARFGKKSTLKMEGGVEHTHRHEFKMEDVMEARKQMGLDGEAPLTIEAEVVEEGEDL